MKRSNVEVKSKLSGWSAIALMAFALSMGKPVLAAEDIKLWHAASKPEDSKALLHLDDKADIEKAINWISPGEKQDFAKLAKTWSKEPLQFLGAVKEAWTKVSKDSKEDKEKTAEFVKATLEGLKKVDAKEFGGKHRKEILIAMVEDMFQQKLDSDTLLKDLFASPLTKLALDITDKEPKKDEPSKPKDETVKTDPTPVVKDDGKKPEKPVVKPEPLKPVIIGEQGNDALDRARAQQVCDAIKGRDSKRDEELNKLFDTMNQLLDRKAAESQINPQAAVAKKNEKGLEDILPGLLANALNQDKKEDITPAASNNQPFVPQSNRNNDRNNTDPNAFNQPLPQQDQPQPQQPFFFPPSTSAGVQVPIRLDLPSNSGRQELRDAQEVSSFNEMRTPVAGSLPPNAGIGELVAAKAKVKTDMQKTQIALSNAKDRAAKLDEQLEELKEGGRAALSPQVKQQQAKLQAEVDAAKKQVDQQRQMMQMVAPEQRDQIQSMLMGLQQDLSSKETTLSQFNAQVDIAVEDGSRQIKALAKVRDQLSSEVNKLQSQLGGMKEDEQAVTALINQNLQLQMAQFQPRGGVQNVNNGTMLQNFAGNGGSPRGRLPVGLGGAMNTQSLGAGAQRGSLAK